MDQRLSLITLGVRDVSQAQTFYEALGWRLDGGVDDDSDHVAFFQAGGLIVALWDRGKLAIDSGVTDTGGWGGVTLAYNVRSPEEVDAVLAEAGAAGATIARPARPRSGAATRASSSTPTATPGRSRTTPAGRCTRTAEPRSPRASSSGVRFHRAANGPWAARSPGSGRSQGLDRRRGDDRFGPACQVGVQGDERIRL